MIIAVNFQLKQLERKLIKLTSLPMCGFIAQLVEHRTGIAEVTGSNPVEALIFFRLRLSNCLSWKFTAMITLHFHLQPQYKYELFHINFTLNILQRLKTVSGNNRCMDSPIFGKYIHIFHNCSFIYFFIEKRNNLSRF